MCAEPLAVVSINMQDKGGYMLVLLYARGRLCGEVLVISAPVYPQNPAQCLDAVLGAQPVDGI